MKRLAIIILIVSLNSLVFGQTKNLRKKFFYHIEDTLLLDSLPIIPSSFTIMSHGQAIHNFKLLWQESKLILENPKDSVLITYRVFPFSLQTDTTVPRPIIIPHYYEIEPITSIDITRKNTGLETQGHFSRGIFFGSGQQPSLSSDFNLTLSGQLDENTEIEAAISDNLFNSNGISGTYNFQDFDRAVISVKFLYARLSLGDIRGRNLTGYFVNFDRSIRGGNFLSQRDSTQWQIGAGVEKGIFNRIKIQGQEGNQGPYRLTGKNGEEMIMIITGSEHVYINGQLKKRGANNDYTIDYTKGDITFTANCLITKDSRITIEYEYWALDYQRYSLWAEMDRTGKSGHTYFGFFQVKDNAAAPVKPLSNEQLQVLYNAGDSASLAMVFSADSVGYSPGKILYCRLDTTVDGHRYTIFRYCQDQRATWQVNFTYIGPGQGDYTLSSMQVNGRVYRWVGPGQGDYMPLRRLPMPERKTVTYAGGRYKLHSMAINYEVAVSDHDLNLISPFGDKDNRAVNLRLGLGKRLSVKDSIFASYMLMQERFATFSPFLPVEFQRDWNIGFGQWREAHHFLLGNKFSAPNGPNDMFKAEGLVYPGQYQGIRLMNTLELDTTSWTVHSLTSYNYSQQAAAQSSFLHSIQNIHYRVRKTIFGLNMEAEENLHHSDSLIPDSYAFIDYNLFVNHGDSSQNLLSLAAGQRYDWIYSQGVLSPLIISTNITATAQIKKGNFTSNTTIHLRSLRDTGQNKNTVIAQTTALWQIPMLGNISLLQQAGQGTQPITEFYFLRVPTGQGQYAWIDFNHDGRQQINEFQLTTFTEQANYVRITLPGIKYIPTQNLRTALSLSIMPSLGSAHWLTRMINHINNQLNLAVNIKNKSQNITQLDYTDTNIVFYEYNLTNTLTLLLTKRLSANYLVTEDINKDLLLGGEKLLQTRLHKISLRYRLPSTFVLELNALTKTQTSSSQLFATENFRLSSRSTKLSITKSGLRLQAQLQASYTQTLDMGSSALLRSARSDITVSLLALRDLRISTIASLIFNQLAGVPNPQVRYLIMQGYGTGWNASNMLTLTYKINKTFTLQADYQLRLTRGRAIHNFGFKLTGWF